MLNNLTDLCLDNIGLNLYLNFKICKKYSLKIPENLGLRIFENSLTINSYFSDNDVEIFNESIIKLKTVDLTRKQFSFLNSLNFLNNQNLDNLFLNNNKKQNSYLNNCFIRTKSLTIDFSLNEEKFKKEECKFLEKNIKCTENIEIIARMEINIIKSFDMIENSIQSIKFGNLTIDFKDFQSLCKAIQTKKQLKKLYLNLSTIFFENNEIHANCLMESFDNIPDSIEYFQLEIFSNQLIFFQGLSNFVKRMKNFKSFSLNRLPCESHLAYQLLESLTEFSSKTLNSLILHIRTIDREMNVHLAKLISKCERLKELRFAVSYEKTSCIDKEFINCLADRIPKLEIFEFPFQGEILMENWKNFEILLPKFRSLKKINFEHYFNEKSDIYILREFMKTLRENLTDLSIPENYPLEIFDVDNVIWNFQKLNVIFLSTLELRNYQGKNIFKIFKDGNCGRVLENFIISYSEFGTEAVIDLKEFLLSCFRLQSINFYEIMTEPQDFGYIFDGLKSSCASLENIFLIECQIQYTEIERLSALLKHCKNIRKLTLLQNIALSCDITFNLLKILKNCRRILKTFQVNSCTGENKKHDDIENLSKDYINLENLHIN